MSFRVPGSPDTRSHSSFDHSSFHSLSESEAMDQTSSSSKTPKLLPANLWNLPYITLSPEILEAASSLDPERVSQLFAASTISKVPPLRSYLPTQPITPFDGSPSNLRSFCSQLVNQIQVESHLSESEKVRFAYQCLGSGALDKMRSSFRCLEDPSIPPEITTLEEFLNALKQRCEDPSLRDQATTRVEGLYQKNTKFHEFITTFEDNMVDSIYSTVNKSHWKLMLERRLSPQLRSLILSASDVPDEYHKFVAYLRQKDAKLQEIIATSRAGPFQNPFPYRAPVSSSRPSRLTPIFSDKTVSQGGSAMDLDTISNEKGLDGRLTLQAKNARRALGRCLWCNKTGHLRSDCPLGSRPTISNTVESSLMPKDLKE